MTNKKDQAKKKKKEGAAEITEEEKEPASCREFESEKRKSGGTAKGRMPGREKRDRAGGVHNVDGKRKGGEHRISYVV